MNWYICSKKLVRHAQKDDKIFSECLGYIGFFSNLKTPAYPGMSAHEVVNVIKNNLAAHDFVSVINILKPEWFVLRPTEIDNINSKLPNLLSDCYSMKNKFDATNKVNDTGLKFGKPCLLGDAIFLVFQRKSK